MSIRALVLVVASAFAAPAFAANLIEATVLGGKWDGTTFFASGTVWDTVNKNSEPNFYMQSDFDYDFTTNLVNDVGDELAGIDTKLAAPVWLGSIAGEGRNANVPTNSDTHYQLTLTFADGSVQAVYHGTTNTLVFNPQAGNYRIEAFRWSRETALGFPAVQLVDAFSNAPGGDRNDYLGLLQISIVPEPGQWALMLSGLGLLGIAAGRRRWVQPNLR